MEDYPEQEASSSLPRSARPVATPRSSSRRLGFQSAIAAVAEAGEVNAAAWDQGIVATTPGSVFFEESNPFLASSKSSSSKSTSAVFQLKGLSRMDPIAPSQESSITGSSTSSDRTKSKSRSKQRHSEDSIDYRNVTLEDLKQARKELKAWEADFKSSHLRTATQDDISKDEIMVKKYRAYGKIKKALAAKEAKDAKVSREAKQSAKEPLSSTDQLEDNSGTFNFSSTVPGTPKRQSRTHHMAAVTRTPTRKQEVEFVSPHRVVHSAGLMSPSRGRSEDDRQQLLSVISSPSMQRTKLNSVSPSKSPSQRSLLSSPSFRSPSGFFTIREQARERAEATSHMLSSDTVSPVVGAADSLGVSSTTPRSQPRTPTSRRINSFYLPNPFQSPTRSRASPLFGGMNNRRPKRLARATAPVLEDLEPMLTMPSTPRKSRTVYQSPTAPTDDLAANALFMKSPLFSTPQKSAAAKAARSLFRRPSASYSTSPSAHLPMREIEVGQLSRSLSTSLRRLSHSQSPSQGLVIQGFDMDDGPEDALNNSPSAVRASLHSTSIAATGSIRQMTSGLLSPTRPRTNYLATTPRTPSRQSSLTFSQATPGSAKSEVDIMLVPAGFHSHYRRRHVRPALFMASQEEDERFEREFLGVKHGGGAEVMQESEAEADRWQPMGMQQEIDKPHTEIGINVGDEDWEDHEGGQDDPQEALFGPLKKAPPSKRYTQKRSTRLHRIAVAPSEKAEKAEQTEALARATRKSTRPRKEKQPVSDDTVVDKQGNEAEAVMNKDEDRKSSNELTKTNDSLAKVTSDSTAYGWAHSNKPMIKSDRRIPGVGQGRAGARRPTTSKFGGSAADGNFVAYNLQRGGFRKGGARGNSRFGRSKSNGYGVGGPGTGRTLFDDESWRTEFDNEFNDAELTMSLAADGMAFEEEDDDEDDMPWYGNVNDVTDPYVVTVSTKYLKPQLGDTDDPEEYIKELELQNALAGGTDSLKDELQGFRVNLEHVLRKVWGYPSFRDGQLDSIKRILNHESSLLVLPTGSGKSLSYQLPAYIFSKLGIPSLTLVISPMISLMYDQVKCLPPGLHGACWTSVEQTAAQFKDFMEKLTSNTIKILFISPEKLQSQSFLSLIRTRRIPRISFLCVDEVHCLSEWSHNFRPAYLLLNHILKTDLNSPCVLGLTGTATEGTKDSICAMLDIDRTTGVLSGSVIRENLAMSVSTEAEREPALLNLLQSPRFASMDSILIYVMKQAQADALAGFLRVRNFSAESYHAGKSSMDRQRIQNRFMNDGPKTSVVGGQTASGSISTGGSTNGIRILVATIAFGLGLNKSNIRSVIHYCMPKSLENYIQEIGRSGRDGAKAYCHMFLNQDDYLRLRSLAYSDGMDWGSVMRLVKKLFSNKDIVNLFASKSGTGFISKAAGKKRRIKKDDKGAKDSDEDDSQEDSFSRANIKKRKQNDQGVLGIKIPKTGSKSEQRSPQSLVLSTASILVIPPISGTSTSFDSQILYRRLVVVREELVEEEFDIKKEVLATLLSYIELDVAHSIKVLGSISAKCTVKFLKTSQELSELVDKMPLMNMIMEYGVLTGNNTNTGSLYGKGRRGNKTGIAGTTLSMAYCCDTMSLCQHSGMAFTELLQELQLWKRKKWIVFEMTDPALCVEILKEPIECMEEDHRRQRKRRTSREDQMETNDPENAVAMVNGEDEVERSPEELEKDHDDFLVALADRLHRKMCAVERVGVAKVDEVYKLFQRAATPTWLQQEVFKPKSHDSNDDDADGDPGPSEGAEENDGGESSEYDEDVDPVFIAERALAKAQARSNSDGRTASKNKNAVAAAAVTESELLLRAGIQVYFSRRSGEGIGGMNAEAVLFRQSTASDSPPLSPSISPPFQSVSSENRTIALYDYQSEVVKHLQQKWRSAVEVDLKVFLNQLWHQQQQSSSTDYGSTMNTRSILDSPRVVSRIFHGISSPRFSALEWSKHKYWAKYVHYDFAELMRMADRIIKQQRQQRLLSHQQERG